MSVGFLETCSACGGDCSAGGLHTSILPNMRIVLINLVVTCDDSRSFAFLFVLLFLFGACQRSSLILSSKRINATC